MTTVTPQQSDRDVVSARAVPTNRRPLPRWAPWAVPALAAAAVGGALVAVGFNPAVFAILTVAVAAAVIYAWSRAWEGARRAKDRVVTVVLSTAFLLAMLVLVSVLVTVIGNGLARFDLEFFTYSMAGVLGGGGGAYHAIVGTLIITGLAAAMSIPVGVFTAIYLVEYGQGRLKRAITFFVDVMTGIPSIVAGLFAYALFVIFFGPGIRLGIMGAVALTVLMIPIVVRATEEMLKIVPNELREASYALGVPKWRTIVKVVLPTSIAGIATGVMLAIARVIGETAPLLITIGLTTGTNLNPFDGRMAALPVFSYFSYQAPGLPREAFIDRAWTAALVLIMIVMVLNLVARLIARLFAPKTR